MTVEALTLAPARVQTPHEFLVLWQEPASRAYHRVGTLTRDLQGYSFSYSPEVAGLAGFEGFAAFPDLGVEYRSAELFPTFANRVMTPRRDSYDAYVRALGLHDAHPEPFEVLARTLGTRATDVVQLLPVPSIDEHGILSLYFLVHGSRHLDPDARRLARISPGARLYLAPEVDNPVSPVAVLVGGAAGPTTQTALGWVPEVIAPLVRELLSTDAAIRAVAEQVNPPSRSHLPDHMRLLVRLDAVAPAGFELAEVLPR